MPSFMRSKNSPIPNMIINFKQTESDNIKTNDGDLKKGKEIPTIPIFVIIISLLDHIHNCLINVIL